MFYLVRSPWWLRKLYPDCIWQMPGKDKKLYLSFDDGPHPEATIFVLDELKKYNAKATFFCIGKNVAAYPSIYNRLIDEGHAVGNHTYNHVNGWKTKDDDYMQDVFRAKEYIDSGLFRPPYGRATRQQLKRLRSAPANFKVIMWTVLSGDFDEHLSGEQCMRNVLNNAGPGSILVFHDSEKAFSTLRYALPEVLDYFSENGYEFCGIKSDDWSEKTEMGKAAKKIGPE